MAIDWGSVLTGGLTGLAAGGPAGAAIGAGAGVINGLFGGGQNTPSYQQYSDPYTSAIIAKLMNSKLGQTASAHTAGELRAQARDQFQALQNNPNLAGNTSALAALNNRLQRQAETGIAGANIAGAQQDEQAQMQAAQLQGQQNQFNLQRNEFEQSRYKANQQPTFTQDLFGKGVNAVIGAALGKQFATTGDDSAEEGLPKITQPDKSQQQIPSLFPPSNNPLINASGSPSSSSDDNTLSAGFNLAPQKQNYGFDPGEFYRSLRPAATGYSPSSVGY